MRDFNHQVQKRLVQYFCLVSWGGLRNLRAGLRNLRDFPRRVNPANANHDPNLFPQYMRRAANISVY